MRTVKAWGLKLNGKLVGVTHRKKSTAITYVKVWPSWMGREAKPYEIVRVEIRELQPSTKGTVKKC